MICTKGINLFLGAIKTKVHEHTADQHGRGRAQAIPLRGWGLGTPSALQLLAYILKKIKKNYEIGFL